MNKLTSEYIHNKKIKGAIGMAGKEYHIGKIIVTLRKQLRLSQTELGKRIYRKATISKIEKGFFLPDKRHLDALLERLGTSMEYYGTYLYEKDEYDFDSRKRNIQKLLWEGRYQEAKKQKETCEREIGKSADNLQQWFFQYVELYLCLAAGEENEVLQKKLEECFAVLEQPSKILYYEEELFLRVLYGELLWKYVNKEKGVHILEELVQYTEMKISNSMKRVKLYPGLALILAQKRWAEGKDIQSLYKKVLKLQQETHRIYALWEWLLLKKESARLGGDFGKAEAQVLDLFARILPEGQAFFEHKMLYVTKESKGTVFGYHMLCIRKCYGYTQAEFVERAENTAAATISRIENGHNIPHADTYRELTGREKERCQLFLKTNDPDVFQMRQKIKLLLEARKYTEAEKGLQWLKEHLDQAEAVNRQTLLYYQVVLDRHKGQRANSELLEDLEEALHLTLPENCRVEEWPLSQMENTILNQIAIIKASSGEMEEAIQLLERLVQSYENNPVSVEDNVEPYLLSLNNLVNYLGDEGEHEKAIGYSEEEIYYAFISGRGYMLANALYNRVWSMECLQYEEKTCLTELKQIFSLTILIDYQLKLPTLQTS